MVVLFALAFSRVEAQTSFKYQVPPQAIVNLVDTRPTPNIEISPKDETGKRWILIEAISGLPSIADLAQPELRLAGLRFNPRTNGPSRGRYITSLTLKALPNGAEKAVTGVPAKAEIRFAAWAPDARHVFFANASGEAKDAGMSLWIVDVPSGKATRLPGIALNGIFGSPCEWGGDSQSLICKSVPKGRGSARGSALGSAP
jgi:hypothetical protein